MSRQELEAEGDALFTAIGLAGPTKDGAVKNAKLRAALVDVIRSAGVSEGCPKPVGALLFTVAGKYPANAIGHRGALLSLITSGGIRTNYQLDAALAYLAGVGSEPLDATALERECGVGVVVTPEETRAAVAALVEAKLDAIREDRYRFNANILLARVRDVLPWVDVVAAKAELESQIAVILGPRTAADDAPVEKKKKEKKPKKDAAAGGAVSAGTAPAGAASAASAAAAATPTEPADPFSFLPRPEENNKTHTTVRFSDGRRLDVANSPDELKAHLARTHGKVVTRFPPEPNGYLHIGHAKAMFVDFGMAERYGGDCYLRFDDTNPEAEKLEYIDHIQEIVAWLGWKPARVTYSSEYFTELHAFAVRLIRGGNAYVCHQTGDEIKASREAREPSPWRDRPVEESLRLFEDMRRGLVDEGAATLRMRMDHKNDNYNMFDLIAYRIKFAPHPHVGDDWCIYPSYDFTHCLVDALEDVTHSMCTLEFESRRASYYWLLDALQTYKPVVWEYSRLNITHNVLSKRRLHRLVHDGLVSGWDDPRLFTLAGLRRRGATPTAINAFCRELGVTRSEGEVHAHKLDHSLRVDLDATSRRRLAVLRPLRIELTNYDPAVDPAVVQGRDFPGRADDGYDLPVSSVVYIERTDFRDEDAKGYFGLAPGKAVMLRYAFPILCTRAVRDASGALTHLEAEVVRPPPGTAPKPPKGVLGWVADVAPGVPPPTLEARLYGPLFTSQSPASSETWLEELSPDSLEVVHGALACPALAAAAPGERFQLERLGYFCVDADSTPDKLVLNRTVTLRDSFPKAAATGGK